MLRRLAVQANGCKRPAASALAERRVASGMPCWASINCCKEDLETKKKRTVELDLANDALDRVALEIFTHKLAAPFQIDPWDSAALDDLGP
jgi:hypothetical protein